LGLSIDGLKLVRLDADVGAALTASLRTDGIPRKLPPARELALQTGLGLVRRALAEGTLDAEAREYFSRLEILSRAVLSVRG
jgi:hypothetical protein